MVTDYENLNIVVLVEGQGPNRDVEEEQQKVENVSLWENCARQQAYGAQPTFE